MSDIRCRKCRRLLMKGKVKEVEIKCPKCRYIQTIKGCDGNMEYFRALRAPAVIEDPESLTIFNKQRRIKQCAR